MRVSNEDVGPFGQCLGPGLQARVFLDHAARLGVAAKGERINKNRTFQRAKERLGR